MYRLVLGAVACLLVGVACAPGAGAPGTAGGGAASAPSGGAPAPAAAASAPLSDAAYRQQVIDGARAEGVVNATIQTTFTPETIKRLEEAIEREYGVRVQINFTPVGNYPQRASSLFSEVEANITPSFDLYQSSDTTSGTLRRANAVEAVNWGPLLPAGTPPAMIAANGEHLVIYTDHFGLMYDPNVVPEAEVPRSLRDLANSRWRGKAMQFSSATSYMPWVFQMGRAEAQAALRGAIQNGSSADTLPNQFTRFASKEMPMIMVTGSFFHTAQMRGLPARFTPLDVSINSDHHVSVARRAAHPNAAKLLAAVLAGPEGQRISNESVGVSSRYYDNSGDSKLEQEARAAGFPGFAWRDHPDQLAFVLSPEGEAIIRELDQILKGG